MSKKLFDFCIGNPPYQEEQISADADGSLKNYAPPVYNLFMEAAYSVADKVELVHPARFLFNAGSTPKAWNQKMLNDEHFKVLHFESNSNNVFSNTDIKGGIAITYRDCDKDFGAIKTFSAFQEVNTILNKVLSSKGYQSIDDIVFSRTSFRLTAKVHEDFPNAKEMLSDGHLYDMSSNIMQRLPFLFFEEKQNANDVMVLGRDDNQRVLRYINSSYVTEGKNLHSYKLFIPQASGRGDFGEALGEFEVGVPKMASTETFLSIGAFPDKDSVENLSKYLRGKFARCMLSILKVTQIGNKPVYKHIPIQDFSSKSDINWSKSIHEIDKQLYKKYGLTKEEIEFIETNVKEME